MVVIKLEDLFKDISLVVRNAVTGLRNTNMLTLHFRPDLEKMIRQFRSENKTFKIISLSTLLCEILK